MTVNAPVCHIPPEHEQNQPGPLALPSIPPAAPNLQSLAATVNAMRTVLLIITGQQGTQGRPGSPGPAGPAGKNSAKGQWSEQSRVTAKVRVYQNNDKTTGNFVEVDQINSLTMANKDTGQTWSWQRGG